MIHSERFIRLLAITVLVASCADSPLGSGDTAGDVAVDSGSDSGGDVASDTVTPDVSPDSGADLTDVSDTAPADPGGDPGDPDVALDAAGDASNATDVTGTDATDATGTDATDATGTDATDATGTDATDATGTDATDATGTDTTTDTGPPPFTEVCGLMTNAGAESGDLTGWTVETGEFEANGSGFNSPDPYAGSYYFFAGSTSSSIMVQSIDVSTWATDIDTGGLWLHLSAQVRDWNGNDGASLILRALDDTSGTLSEMQAGPWYTDSWTPRSADLELPVGTRTVQVGLRGDRESGFDNDAYFDELALCFDAVEPVVDVSQLLAPPYLMWVTEDAVTVMWETAAPSIGTVEYGETLQLGSSMSEPVAVTTHELRLEGLPSNQTIYYRIDWGQGFSDTFDFSTAPDPAAVPTEPFTFVVWADNQDGPDNFSTLIPHMLAEDPKFAVSAGDCVQNGTRPEYRSQLFQPIAPLARHVPFLIASGNHELYSDPGAALFEEYLAQPGSEHCFGWRYGPVYMQFIDTELPISVGSPQYDCIMAGLTSAEALSATYRTAIFHKPPRIEYWFGGVLAFTFTMEAPWVREELEPLLETLDVHLVFNGHNHQYAYTPETPGGITWVTSGGAGGMLDTASFLWKVGDWPEITVQIHEHHFLAVDVTDTAITVRAIDLGGNELTSFSVSP